MTLTLPAAPAIPGLRFRSYGGEADHPAMHAVHQAAGVANGLEEVTTLEQFALNYRTLVNCDPHRDIVLAEVDGSLVAYSRVFWQDLVEGGRTYENFGFVHPDWRRRGIGTALHRRNEARLREIAAEHGGVAPKWFASERQHLDVGASTLLERDGYTAARWFHDMVLPSLDGVAAPPLPAGIEIRPVTRDQYRRIWEAEAEAFRDHWGEQEWTEADWQRFEQEPDMADPSLWRIGWDGDQIAGVIITTVPAEENERYGRRGVYVAGVSVRRPWRRRGLARALLASSLVASREAGYTSASLGVDADSPTGATALYTSLGFRPERSFVAYRKPLED
jgi:mycothiol synthase